MYHWIVVGINGIYEKNFSVTVIHVNFFKNMIQSDSRWKQYYI